MKALNFKFFSVLLKEQKFYRPQKVGWTKSTTTLRKKRKIIKSSSNLGLFFITKLSLLQKLSKNFILKVLCLRKKTSFGRLNYYV